MARLLGRLQWVSSLVGASSPILAGAYAAMHVHSHVFPRALARATSTSLLFALSSHTVQLGHPTRRVTIFAYAAPCGSRFRIGLVARKGVYKQQHSSAWLQTLQHVELYAAYNAIPLAAYRKESAICVGIDDDAARTQVTFLRSSKHCPVQLRILSMIFWLTAWASVGVTCFPVTTLQTS